MNISHENRESMDSSSISKDGTEQRQTLLSGIKENNETSSSPAQPPEEAHGMDRQGRQIGNTPGRSRDSSVFDAELEEEHYVRKPRPRKGSSSYAASTKASQARQNEKVEITSARQRAFSTLDALRVSPVQRSHSTFKSSRAASPVSDSLPESPWEQKDEAHRMRHSNPDPKDFQMIDSHSNEHEAEISRNWTQKKQKAEDWPVRSEHALLEKEGLKRRLKELETERDKAHNIRGHLQLELEMTKNEVVKLRQHNSELEAKIEQSTAASAEREGRTEIKLRVREAEADNWKQKHDELTVKVQELEERIEARNRLESRLPLLEAVQDENKRLQATVTKKQKELKEKQKELDEISEYAKERDNEIMEGDKKLAIFRNFLSDTNQVMTKWAQASSHGPRVEISEMDSLIRRYAGDSDTKELLTNTRKLLENFVHKHEMLESRLEDKDYEIANMKKGMEARMEEIEDAVQRTPGLNSSGLFLLGLPSPGPSTPASSTPGLMTSGFTRASGLLQHDREGFEGLYEDEVEKRKAAEKKVQDVNLAKKQQLRLQQAKKELQLRLSQVLEENDVLRKEAEEAKLQASLWKDESEQSKLELDKRSTEFQSSIDQNEQEKDQYIKYYHTEAQDASRWEAASLHKKLEEQEQEYKTLKQEFDRSKAINARRQVEIASLEKKCMIQSKHINDVEEAIFHNEELPKFPNLDGDDEDEDEYDFELDAYSPLSPLVPSIHPSRSADRRPNPRYEHPNAIATRTAKLEAYRAELQARTEEELQDFIFKAPCMPGKKDKTSDDIIEKVRKLSFGGKYPPSKEEWNRIRSMSVWERWQGEKWAAQCTEKRFVEVLKNRGILEYY